MKKSTTKKDICNKVTAIGTILPTSIIRYEEEYSSDEESTKNMNYITEFILSIKHSIENEEKESRILCRSSNQRVELACNDIKSGDRVYVSGNLSIASTAAIDLNEIKILDQDAQSDYLHAAFTGWLKTSPHLFHNNSEQPYATYTLEVETDEDYTYLQIPCRVVGALYNTVEADFHHGAFVTVEGDLYTIMHQELTTTPYDITHTEPSIEDMCIYLDDNGDLTLRTKSHVYLPELFVTFNALTPEGQTQKNRELTLFQELIKNIKN